MPSEGLYERVLAGMRGEPTLAARPPRASASVVLWRRNGDGELEVFWVRRAPELKFMGGWYAFPGGAVGKEDSAVAVEGLPSGVDEAPVDGGMPAEFLAEAAPLPAALAPGVVAAALRELHEETGVRLASAASLVYAGRWLTPPLGPIRFDNRFFLLEWPADRAEQPRVVPGELASGEWVHPREALVRWRSGRILAAPPILHILRTFAEDGPVAGLPRLRDASEANVASFRRIEFAPGALSFPLATPTLPPATHTNAYLLGFGECVLVDPGSPDPREQRRLLEALAHLEVAEGRRVTEIWLTHHHPDHVGGVTQVAGELDVPVLAHTRTAERLTDLGVAVHGELAEGVARRLEGPEPMTLRVLHTPGHARGHLCFLDVERGSLVAGDLVSAVSTIVVDPPEGDMDDYLASLERLRAMPLTVLLPAHGPAVPEPARHLAELIEHRLWREERILDAWRGGRTDPQAMLPTVYDDVPELAWPVAARQIEAHLERLRRAGRLPDV